MGHNQALIKYQEKLVELCERCGKVSGLTQCQLSGSTLQLRHGEHNLLILTGTDPGVLEIKTQPLTYRQTDAWAPVIDTFLFGAAKAMGDALLDPSVQSNRWSGHLNVSWPGLAKALIQVGSDPEVAESMGLVLNFYVDLQNHPELGMGVLGGDTRNAAPLAFGIPDERARLKRIVEEFKNGSYKTILGLTLALTQVNSFSFADRYQTPGREHRYGMINAENIGQSWNKFSGSRLEVRSFFSPRNTAEMLSNYRIVANRLVYLKQSQVDRGAVLDFKHDRFIQSQYKVSGLQPGVSLEAAARAYVSYLRDAGLNPQDEVKFLRDPEVQRAVRTQTRRWCF
jgi:hypothetical protein